MPSYSTEELPVHRDFWVTVESNHTIHKNISTELALEVISKLYVGRYRPLDFCNNKHYV